MGDEAAGVLCHATRNHCHTSENEAATEAVRREPGRPRADSVPSWWRPGCIKECVVEVPVLPFREETGELTNRDQLLDVPVTSIGVKVC